MSITISQRGVVYWMTVIRSLITQDVKREALIAHTPVPAWAERAPYVPVPTKVRYDRDDPWLAEIDSLRDHLPVKARLVFAQAFTKLMQLSHKNLIAADYQSEEDLVILEKGFFFSDILGGAVQADVLEEMALDRRFPHRTRAASGLCRGHFMNGAPEDFWQKIEADLASHPSLLFPAMSRLRHRHRNPLVLLKHFAERPKLEGLTVHVHLALRDLKELINWRSSLRRLLEASPPWVKEMMDKDFKEIVAGYEEGQ